MSKKLLLADDSITIQKVIGITFANEDYSLEIVDNGDAALEKALEARPDLILADVYMPGKNGYELCDTVKKEASLDGVPVLLLTGTFEPFDEDRARAVGADDWIAKPFESQALIDKVEELLAKGGRAVQSATPATVASTEETLSVETPLPTSVQPPASFAQAETAAADNDSDFESLLSIDENELIDEPQTWAADPEPSFLGEEDVPLEENFGGKDHLFEDASDDEDLWGAVSLEEEALMDEFAEEEPVGDDLWGSLNDELTMEEPKAQSVSAPLEETSPPPFEEDEEEILALDESDILETEEFLAGEDETDLTDTFASDQENDSFAFDEEEFLAPEEPSLSEAPDEISEEFAFEDQEFQLGDDEDSAQDEILASQVSPPTDVVEQPVFEEPVEEMLVSEQSPVEEEAQRPVAASAPLATATVSAVEQQVQALSEADLTRIVEQVAAKVLEKIAWEVVPDLAETLIVDEIRKIKERVD